MKRVLITGVTGYIGSRLARSLLPECEVYGLVREPLRPAYIGEIRDRLRLVTVDGSYGSVESALDGVRPDLVYHLAAYYTGAHGAEDTPALLDSNVVFGAYLLEAMAACGCPALVYASTVMTRRQGGDYCPLNLYAATKQAFSDLLEYYTDAGLLRAVTLVLSDTYGPGDRRPKILNLVRRAAAAGEHLALSDGGQDYDVVHIDDAVRAFRMAGEQLLEGRSRGGVFQIFPEAPLTLRATVEKMLQINGCAWQGGWGERPAAGREMRRAVRAYPPLPGWRPRVSLEEGLRQLWDGR